MKRERTEGRVVSQCISTDARNIKNVESSANREGKELKGKAILGIGILLSSMITFLLVMTLSAILVTEVYLAPSDNTFATATTSFGYKWNVTAWVKDATDLFAYQVYLAYNATLLNATRAWIPTWDPEWVFYGKNVFIVEPLLRNGYVQLGATLLGDTPYAGTGKLVIIEFQIVHAPSKMEVLSTTLNINNPDTYLLDSKGDEQNAILTDGSYTYTWSPPAEPYLAVNPTLLLHPRLGMPFNISLYIRELDVEWYLTNATMSICFNATVIDVVGGAANITIDSNWMGPNEVVAGVSGKINLTVRNPTMASGDVLVATITFTAMNRGGTNVTFCESRLHDHVVEVPTGPPQNGFVSTEKGINDIAVTALEPSKTIVGRGTTALIKVTLENQGNYTETFNVTAYANTTAIQTEVVSLSNGTSTTVIFTWNTISISKGNYTISAYVPPVTDEVDTADNNLTDGQVVVAMFGDITGPTPNVPDGKVDIRDIALAAFAFGTYPSHPLWNPNADINSDNKVDIRDIAAIARNFGEIDP